MNSIISEQNLTINKLRTELCQKKSSSESYEYDSFSNVKVGNLSKFKPKKIREYCDHCEVFDLHDTNDCSKEATQRAELCNHVATLSPLSKNPISTRPRPFCNYCEAFLHPTNECPEKT